MSPLTLFGSLLGAIQLRFQAHVERFMSGIATACGDHRDGWRRLNRADRLERRAQRLVEEVDRG